MHIVTWCQKCSESFVNLASLCLTVNLASSATVECCNFASETTMQPMTPQTKHILLFSAVL